MKKQKRVNCFKIFFSFHLIAFIHSKKSEPKVQIILFLLVKAQ